MAKDKSTLFGARDLAQRISEMLDYAAEAEGKHEERVAARAEHETLVSRNKELKAENAARNCRMTRSNKSTPSLQRSTQKPNTCAISISR